MKGGITAGGARLILGGVFIYASFDKIAHPAAFAEAVYNCQILPEALISLTAIILPWMELILDLFSIIGLFLEGSACIASVLLLFFFGATIINLTRGLDIHCGCFTTSEEGTNRTPMVWYVIRDSIFLVPALFLFHRTFWIRRRTQGV